MLRRRLPLALLVTLSAARAEQVRDISIPQRISPAGLTFYYAPGNANATGVTQYNASLGAPLILSGPHMLLLTLRGHYRRLDRTLFFDNGALPLSVDWSNVDSGLIYVYRNAEDTAFSTRATIGSAADRLFSGMRGVTFTGIAAYSWRASEASRWTLGVYYSNNSSFAGGIPVPGVSYTYTPSPSFQMTVGIPQLTMRWEFLPETWFTFSALLPTNVRAEVQYGPLAGVRYFAAFHWLQHLYLRRDREREMDRLFFDEKRIFGGVRIPLGEWLTAEGQVGYSFSRTMFEDRSYFSTTARSIPMGDSAYLGLSLNVELPAPEPPAK